MPYRLRTAYKVVPSDARTAQKRFTLEHVRLFVMNLWIIFLFALPVCWAQFSIQGPSDGNRRAQGLKYSREKGIEYTSQSDSLDNGGFTIQGATDGNSNFRIQGATDSNSNFRIQGATDSNANFQIQGPTDGGSNSYIQGAYDANQPNVQPTINEGGGRALEYKDPSGLRVNWRSYAHQQRPQYQQPAPQYASQPARPATQSRRQPTHRQPQPQPQAQAPIHRPSYTPVDNAPERIKQLLLFQQQIPYINSIPEPYRYDGTANAQAQAEQFRQEYPKQVQQQLTSQPQQETRYRSKPRGSSRSKRQIPQQQYAQQQQRQQPQHNQPQYRRIAQPPPEPQPQYSTNLPGSIQQLLKYQAQIPYDIIANRITYRPDKPYVPQPVQQASVQQNQYQNQVLPYNQNQGQAYGQNQGQAYSQNQGQYYGQAYGQQQQQVRPVTERQY